ncbi:hypothetical protein QVD17_38458 [Tagetes erecta]|uniref:Glycosyltransferase N-terminal domain-containing protein n=1 Tax=Tagetes erecta TaxID=13708 RepID=A0AAD8JLU2_TARER|nr:hypothetical protein QVD17_38458 [Tagetes erecta]
MGSNQEQKPHAVCIPAPLQGHINPMLKLAKILHSKGFFITFVNTEFNHQRLLRSHGLDSLDGLPSFRFETIPEGLPPPKNPNASQDIPTLAKAVEENCLGPFKRLVTKVNDSYAPVTCIVADLLMGFTIDAATELGIPEILLWTSGSGSLICYNQYPKLLENKLMPLKDPSYLTNGYLDTVIDCIPTTSGIRLKDVPPFIRKIYPGDDYMVEYFRLQLERAKKASAIMFNTFDELEHDVLESLASICNKWGVAMEIDNKVKSDEVAKLVVKMMEGEKGKEIRKNVIELKNKALEACTSPFGSSMVNLDKVVQLMYTFSK